MNTRNRDTRVRRRVEFRLYPTKAQVVELERLRTVAAECYNFHLQERRWLFEEWGLTTNLERQRAGLKWWRQQKAAWAAVHSHILHVAVIRVDLAFQAFFRRVKAGTSPGYPRLKSPVRMGGFGFHGHGNGFRVQDVGAKGCRIRISGIGSVPARGRARFDLSASSPKTMDVLERAGKWYASVAYSCDVVPDRARKEHRLGGLDWGVRNFATIASVSKRPQNSEPISFDDVEIQQIQNPRHLRKALENVQAAQRALNKKKQGSKRYERKQKDVAKIHSKVACQRKDFLHQTTKRIVEQFSVLAVEKLNVPNMAKSGRRMINAFNRELLAASPGKFHQILSYKAEEAGVRLVWADPERDRATETCCVSGAIAPKKIAEYWHVLPDGERICRDENAARVLLSMAYDSEQAGNPPGVEGAPKGASDEARSSRSS